MEKQKVRAFTLVEIIVVISIMTLLSTTWVFYFVDFVKTTQQTKYTQDIKDILEDYENKIKNKNIYDFEALFNRNQPLSLYVYSNVYDNPYVQTIVFDGTTKIAALNRSHTGSIQFYTGNKLFTQKISPLLNENYSFSGSQRYQILWKTISLDNQLENFNEIDFYYLWENNIDSEDNNDIKIVNINTQIDGSGTNINILKYQNIYGNKTLFWDGVDINEAHLFIEYAWKIQTITLNNN